MPKSKAKLLGLGSSIAYAVEKGKGKENCVVEAGCLELALCLLLFRLNMKGITGCSK